MNKLIAVLKREYLQAVRKKSFIIMTILAPVLMSALMVVPAWIATKGMGSKKIAIVDGTGKLRAGIEEQLAKRGGRSQKKPDRPTDERAMARKAAIETEYVDASGAADVDAAAQPYKERVQKGGGRGREADESKKLDGLLIIPADVVPNSDAKIRYYSRSSTELIAQERLGRSVSRAVAKERLVARGLDPAEIDRLTAEVDVDAFQIDREGKEKKGSELGFLGAFAFVALLFTTMLLYGQEVMRGIIQEKSDRVVEILISSMTPMQLLSGKVLGLAAVGLTQLAIWVTMMSAVGTYAAGMMAMSGINLSQILRPAAFAWFFVFFILGFLIYVSVYAVGGSVVNSEKEAQQFLGPIVMVLMVPWFLMMPILMNPESTFSVVLSLVPVYTPITMFVRILVSQPPIWQIALSIALSIGTIFGLFWMTAKIFRIGILSYGKRPTIPELWRWMKVA